MTDNGMLFFCLSFEFCTTSLTLNIADHSILSVTHTASSTFNSPRVPPSRVMMPPTPVMYLRAHSAPPFNLRDDFHFPGSTSPADHESRSTTVPQRFIRTTFSASSTPISSLLELQEEQPRHIPRPPNAFMLYRSDFLKRRAIPEEIERRQQNLSRIAGQCWRMLSAEEKAVWNNKAAEVAAAHHAKYPDYKFRPVRKGAKKQTGKKIDKPLKSGASRGRGSGKLTRESDIVESSIGPARRPCRSHARPSPYDGGLSASLQLPITPSMTVSPSASPPSLNPLLYPIAPFDGSAGAAAFDNTSQVQIPHCQDILSLAPTLSQYSVFSSGKTPADIIQDLTLVRQLLSFSRNLLISP